MTFEGNLYYLAPGVTDERRDEIKLKTAGLAGNLIST